MASAGGTDIVTLDLDQHGSDTVATLTVIGPDRVATHPTASPVATGDPALANKTWHASVSWPTGGLYVYQWTVTGTGARVGDPVTVSVGPGVLEDDGRTSYATTAQLARFLAEAPPVESAVMLKDASEKLDGLLVCAVYDVDAAGLPTDTTVAAALANATCAVVKRWIAYGEDGTGAATTVTSASIGGVSIGYKGGGADLIGDEARRYLTAAGLLGREPWLY